MTGQRSAGKIETKDRRGREEGVAIFSELKIADFPGLCVASVRKSLVKVALYDSKCLFLYPGISMLYVKL